MKFPISWHEENLRILSLKIERERTTLRELEDKIMEMEKRATFIKVQISEAYLQGKTEFDPEKFCVKRKSR